MAYTPEQINVIRTIIGEGQRRYGNIMAGPGRTKVLSALATAAVEQGVRTGFNFSRKGFNADVGHRFSAAVRGSARYTFGTTRIFDDIIAEEGDQLTVDRAFPQVRLSTVSGTHARSLSR